MIGWW